MASKPLTEKMIDRIATPDAGKRTEVFDKYAPGLAMRVASSGVKSWVMHYRFDGKLVKQTLGRWPQLTVDEARREARTIRDNAEAGVDPRAAKEQEQARQRQQAEEQARALLTFGSVAEDFIRRETPKLTRGQEYESMIRRRLLPEWQHKPIMSLRRRDAVRLLDKIVDEGKPGAAVRAWEIIRRVFNWAVDREDIEVNPMQGLKRPAKKEPRQRALNDDEIRVLWKVWSDDGYPFGTLQKFLLLTGQRRGEAAKMQWSEIDWDNAVWTIPKERSKNGKAHEVPLSAAALDLLRGVPQFVNGGPFVFSTTGGEKPVLGFSKAKTRTDRLSASVGRSEGVTVASWCLHDLRRTARTEMARIGVSDEVAERVLNHSGDSLVRTYNVFAYRAEKKDALERWASELMMIVGEREPDSNVVRLDAAG